MQTNVAAQAPPTPRAGADGASATVGTGAAARARDDRGRARAGAAHAAIRNRQEKPKPVEKPTPPRKSAQQDFNALLNKLTAPDKPVKNAKPAAARHPRRRGGQSNDRQSGGRAEKPDLSLLEPPDGFAADRANDLVVEFDLRLNPDGTGCPR